MDLITSIPAEHSLDTQPEHPRAPQPSTPTGTPTEHPQAPSRATPRHPNRAPPTHLAERSLSTSVEHPRAPTQAPPRPSTPAEAWDLVGRCPSILSTWLYLKASGPLKSSLLRLLGAACSIYNIFTSNQIVSNVKTNNTSELNFQLNL